MGISIKISPEMIGKDDKGYRCSTVVDNIIAKQKVALRLAKEVESLKRKRSRKWHQTT